MEDLEKTRGIINSANKGGSAVKKFINESNRQLLEQYSYTLREDPTLHRNEMFDDKIE